MEINRFWALCLRRKGAPIPRWQQSQSAWFEGLLRVAEEKDAILGRHVLMARLVSPERGDEVLPPLVDAKLLHVSDHRMVISGMERDDLTRVDMAQAWLLLRGREKPQGAGSL